MKKNLILIILGILIAYLLANPPNFVLNQIEINYIDYAGTTNVTPVGDSFLFAGIILGIFLILFRYFFKLIKYLLRQIFNKSS